MNAVTKAEAHAIETAALLEVADPTKNLSLVALSQLQPRRSKRNASTTPRLSIPELAASISRVGLLQNLIVIAAADGKQYEVVAGDRRLTAMKLLAKKKRIPADYEVPCLLVPDASARTVSLAENLLREQMQPADQFEAFAALVMECRPIEDIAADFGVSPLLVQRRLKLTHGHAGLALPGAGGRGGGDPGVFQWCPHGGPRNRGRARMEKAMNAGQIDAEILREDARNGLRFRLRQRTRLLEWGHNREGEYAIETPAFVLSAVYDEAERAGERAAFWLDQLGGMAAAW